MPEVVRATLINIMVREETIDALNEALADTLFAVLASKFAHWNVKGPGFYPAHKLFDQINEYYVGAADTIGERITALGGNAEGLITDVVAGGDAIYNADASDNVEKHTKAMAELLAHCTNRYREVAEDCGKNDGGMYDLVTQNLLLELSQEGDKQLYFLEASLRLS